MYAYVHVYCFGYITDLVYILYCYISGLFHRLIVVYSQSDRGCPSETDQREQDIRHEKNVPTSGKYVRLFSHDYEQHKGGAHAGQNL